MLTLNYRDSRPIYEQIKDGLRRMIVTGAMAQDEKLPSVRALATQLSINPNTIQRAYNELEAEGYIYSVAGKGSFVSGRSRSITGGPKLRLGTKTPSITSRCSISAPERSTKAISSARRAKSQVRIEGETFIKYLVSPQRLKRNRSPRCGRETAANPASSGSSTAAAVGMKHKRTRGHTPGLFHFTPFSSKGQWESARRPFPF